MPGRGCFVVHIDFHYSMTAHIAFNDFPLLKLLMPATLIIWELPKLLNENRILKNASRGFTHKRFRVILELVTRWKRQNTNGAQHKQSAKHKK
jgi:hypothetical protein